MNKFLPLIFIIALVAVSGCVEVPNIFEQKVTTPGSKAENSDISVRVQLTPQEVLSERSAVLEFEVQNLRNDINLTDVTINFYDLCDMENETPTMFHYDFIRPNMTKYNKIDLRVPKVVFDHECKIKYRVEYNASTYLMQDIAVLTEGEYAAREIAGTLGEIQTSTKTVNSPISISFTLSESQPIRETKEGEKVHAYFKFIDAGNGIIDKLETGSVGLKIPENLQGNCKGFADSGPIGYWKFDEGSGSTVADSSGHSISGTIRNFNENQWVDGKYGKALSFNVANYVDFGDVNSLEGLPAETITAWIKINDFSGSLSEFHTIVSKGRGEHLDLFVLQNGHVLGFVERGKQSNPMPLNGQTILEQGKWYFVASVYDGSKISLYVNGNLDGSTQAQLGETINNEKEFQIGKSNTDNSYFNGVIDEVRIYNRALSADEIQKLYMNIPFNDQPLAFINKETRQITCDFDAKPRVNIDIGTFSITVNYKYALNNDLNVRFKKR